MEGSNAVEVLLLVVALAILPAVLLVKQAQGGTDHLAGAAVAA